MKKYQVEITEIMQRVIEVHADSPDEAVEEIRALYKNEDIVLDSSDYMDTDISLFSED